MKFFFLDINKLVHVEDIWPQKKSVRYSEIDRCVSSSKHFPLQLLRRPYGSNGKAPAIIAITM